MTDADAAVDQHRAAAIAANARAWSLLERAERTDQEAEELLFAAYASAYHWRFAGTSVHRQRALYLIARVYVALGERAGATRFAHACLESTERTPEGLADFDYAFAHEIMARAAALAADGPLAAHHYRAAAAAGAAIQDAEDRTIFEQDLLRGPWFGFSPP